MSLRFPAAVTVTALRLGRRRFNTVLEAWPWLTAALCRGRVPRLSGATSDSGTTSNRLRCAVRSPTLTPTQYPQSLQTHSCGLHQARRTTGGSNTRQLVASRPSELRQSDWRSPVVEPNYGSGSMLSPGSPSSPYSGNQNRMPGSPPAPMSPPPGGGQQHGGGSSIGTDAPIMCYRRGHQFVPVEEEYNQRRVRPRVRPRVDSTAHSKRPATYMRANSIQAAHASPHSSLSFPL